MWDPRGTSKKVLRWPSVLEVREGRGEGEGIVLEMLHQAISGIGRTKEIRMKAKFGSIEMMRSVQTCGKIREGE
jgi:hypothetical protein